MDRVSLRLAAHLALLSLSVLTFGAGCSRLKTYRAQDSPLPGMSFLGRGDRTRVESSRLANVAKGQRSGDVAWSGPPQNGKPAPRPRRLAPRPAPTLGTIVTAPPSAPPATSAQPLPATGSAVADESVATVKTLIATGRESLGRIQTYQVSMTRQERVGESLLPSETLLLSVRRSPKAVRLEWSEGDNKGREVLYSSAENEGQMHIKMPNSVLLPRMSLAPDSPLVMRNSRHPITEAGLDAILDKMESSLGDQVVYEGTVQAPEVGAPCHKITRKSAEGEAWIIYLDSKSAIPLFVQATGPDGQLLERYLFRDLVPDPPTLAEASAFDPDARWGAPKGLLGRMAQGRNSATSTK